MLLLGLLINVFGIVVSNQEFKSYTATMKNKLELLNLNRELLSDLNTHVDKMKNQNENIDKLKRLCAEFERPLRLAEGREEEFLSNPLNTYSLIRHMHWDWLNLENSENMTFIEGKRSQLPRKEHLEEALEAMRRIQRTFQLNQMDMAKGLLNGEQYDAKLSFLDCIELGIHYLRVEDFENASKWFQSARILMDELPPELIESYKLLNATRSRVCMSMAKSLVAEGLLEEARTVLRLEPELSSNVRELLIAMIKNHWLATDELDEEDDGIEEYGEICSPYFKNKPTRLLCSYKTNPSEFLRLAPLKQEVLSMDPYVVVFHDIIYDSEITQLRRLSEPNLTRTSVFDSENDGVPSYSRSRTSSGVWVMDQKLDDDDNVLIERIERRLGHMSELSIDFYAGEVQFMEYVFGGHYAAHCDFLNMTNNPNDRIATIILYLNDMPIGGSTAFLDLDIVVRPEKGKALFWYNIMPGTQDFEERSLHAACPVLMGKKQIVTHWIREEEQMFLQPCLHRPVTRYSSYFN